MSAGTIDMQFLQQWVGREQSTEQLLHPFPAAALAGQLGLDVNVGVGTELPVPWQWLYFLDATSRAQTGADGHPQRGGFLPPVPLPRRMWAAGRMQIGQPLVVGRVAKKTSSVREIQLKQGKAGPLVFVVVDHRFEQDGRHCISEEQTIVYREAPTAAAPLPPGESPAFEPKWQETYVPDPVSLFRFSALTYNGHRIHYDRHYAVNEEFYPGLVVHGPLLATLLANLLFTYRPHARLNEFSFRASRPAFDFQEIRLCGAPLISGADLWTLDPDGFVGMTARASFESPSSSNT